MIKKILVDLGVRKIQIPVAQITGKKDGKRLLVTAGADGDEYAGIEAAYKLIKEFSAGEFSGQLTVIPILNLPGFEATQSENPLDNKYPKHIFPGKKNGSPSERLIYWLAENYLDLPSVWLDLHGGGITELLDPYIYIYETKNKQVNKIAAKILKTINAPKIVFEKPGAWRKVELLAKRGIVYLITEAGCSGERSKIEIDKHIEWTKTVMAILQMIDKSLVSIAFPRIYRQISRYQIRHSGLWHSVFNRNDLIQKGQKLGEIRSFDGRQLEEIFAKEDGEYLWMKKDMFCPKGEAILEVGYKRRETNFLSS